MTTSNSIAWVDLPLADEPLDSAVLLTDSKHGSELSLRLRSGREVTVPAGRLQTVIDGQVEVDISPYDDFSMRIQYRAENLSLRGLRVGWSADYEEDFRSDAESWAAAGMTTDLNWICDVEARLGNGQPAAAAQADTS